MRSKTPPPDNFAAFILTHGRPDKCVTYRYLRQAGYTGPIYLIVDDEDKTVDQYRANYGDAVIQFSKAEYDDRIDIGDNFPGRATVTFARNACFDIARDLGLRFFMQLDDDYSRFDYRFDSDGYYTQDWIKDFNAVLRYMIDYLSSTPFISIAMGQGGDYMGGSQSSNAKVIGSKRKVMNTFLCDVEKPFRVQGRMNDDVNSYTEPQRRGLPFLTILGVSVNQKTTQASSGGLTEMYLDYGTYVKSFYTMLYMPSACRVVEMGTSHKRIHHAISWDNCAPKIVPERFRKQRAA